MNDERYGGMHGGMGESEMVDLLERATEPLRPDVGRLVAGGERRGRARRRRTAGAAAAAVALIGLGAGIGVATQTHDPGRPGPEPAPAAGGVSAPAHPWTTRYLYYATDPSVSSRLARLLAGATDPKDGFTRNPEVAVGSVDWRGLHVSVRVSHGVPAPAHDGLRSIHGVHSTYRAYLPGDRHHRAGTLVTLRLTGAQTGDLRGALTSIDQPDRWQRIVRSPLWRREPR